MAYVIAERCVERLAQALSEASETVSVRDRELLARARVA